MIPGDYGATLQGDRASLVRVEALLGRGLSRTILVGRPDAVAKEAPQRLPAAFRRLGLDWPNGKVLFNLVPAQLRKGGFPLDLALAAALLRGIGKLGPPDIPRLLLAEVDLQGRLGPPSHGTLLAALASHGSGVQEILTTPDAAVEASLVPGTRALGFDHLEDVIAHLEGGESVSPTLPPAPESLPSSSLRLDDVRGQGMARAAVEITVAGRHNLLLHGPPGTGKSLLAARVAGLLPPLGEREALELARVEALLAPLPFLPASPPFRAPHTSASAQAILGGGRPIRPGEISRAHGGVLFLDELPEFPRPLLEGLRQPLEENEVRLHRTGEQACFPADCLLVAAMNPCPCGFSGHPVHPCRCTQGRLQSYQLKTSGPLLDRFDLCVEMGPVPATILQGPPTAPTDEDVRARLRKAWNLQNSRKSRGGFGASSTASLESILNLGATPQARQELTRLSERFALSGRGNLRLLRVARTLADLEGMDTLEEAHLKKAVLFRVSLPSEEEARV